MIFPRQVSLFSIRTPALGILLLLMIASCTLPKRYHKDKPFVFKTEINIDGEVKGTAKQQLKSGLENQLADSLRVRTIVALGFPAILYKAATDSVW